METLLNVEGINVYYGAIHAIKDISFHVNEGEIVTLIGNFHSSLFKRSDPKKDSLIHEYIVRYLCIREYSYLLIKLYTIYLQYFLLQFLHLPFVFLQCTYPEAMP